jgi:hypothetical protein
VDRRITPPNSLLLKPGAAPALTFLMQEGSAPRRGPVALARKREGRENLGFAILLAALFVSVLMILSVLPAADDMKQPWKIAAPETEPPRAALPVKKIASTQMQSSIGVPRIERARIRAFAHRHSPRRRPTLNLPAIALTEDALETVAVTPKSFRHHSPHRAKIESLAPAGEDVARFEGASHSPRARPRLPIGTIAAAAPPPSQGVIAVEVLARPQRHSPQSRPRIELVEQTTEVLAPPRVVRAQEFWRTQDLSPGVASRGRHSQAEALATGSLGGPKVTENKVPVPRRAMRRGSAKPAAKPARGRCWNRIWRCAPLQTASSKAELRRRKTSLR